MEATTHALPLERSGQIEADVLVEVDERQADERVVGALVVGVFVQVRPER